MLRAPMHDGAPTADDSLMLALDIEPTLEQTWRWATQPVDEAREVGVELAALATRRDLPLGGLRALTQLALGEPARPAVVDRWLERDPEVVAMLRRVAAVARALEGLPSRARVASRNAMALSLAAPRLSRLAAAEVFHRGPSPDRDAVLLELERLPLAAKRRADEIRARSLVAASLAERAREGILAGLRSHGRPGGLVRTERLVAV